MRCVFGGFGGIFPRLKDHQLAAYAATIAHDVKLRNGVLEPWMENCHFADAVEDARSFDIFGCCPITWQDLVTTAHMPPDWKRHYIAGRQGNGLEAVEIGCECKVAYYAGGVPAPLSPPVANATEECSREADARSYVYTYLNKWGEESASSPASNVVRVDDGTTVTVTGLADPPEGYGITHIVLYRAATGFRPADGKLQKFDTAYLFVTMIPVPLEDDEYEDTALGVSLGWALETQDDRFPPFMSGVLSIRDQIRLVGWHKNRIYMSANLQPYNWPAQYDITLDHTIIHMGELDQRLFVTTDSTPYIIDVSSCDDSKCTPVTSVDTALPDIGCRKSNSAVMTPHGLFYASTIGLILLSPNAEWHVVTAKWFGEDEWRKLKPDTITMAYYEGYLFFSTDMATFLLDINADPYGNAENTELVTLSDHPVACRATNTGELVLLQDDELVVWSKGDMPREYIWQSRRVTGGKDATGSGDVDVYIRPQQTRPVAAVTGPLWSPASVALGGPGHIRIETPHGRVIVDRTIAAYKPVRCERTGRHTYYTMTITSKHMIPHVEIGTSVFTLHGGE